MNKAKAILDRMRIAFNVETYKQLSDELGVSANTLDTWKRRESVPEQHILRCIQMTGLNEQYLRYGHTPDNKHTIQGNHNISINGVGNSIGNNVNNSSHLGINSDIDEIYELLLEYGTPKLIKELKEKLYQLKELHG